MANLEIGISGLGILHTDAAVPDVDTKFRMVRDCGAFDYVDRTPPQPELEAHQRRLRSTGFRCCQAASSTWSDATRHCSSEICVWGAIVDPDITMSRYSCTITSAGLQNLNLSSEPVQF